MHRGASFCALIAGVLAMFSCAGAAPYARPLWSVRTAGGNAVWITGGAVVLQTGHMDGTRPVQDAQALDAATGATLWEKQDTIVLPGTPLFLAQENTLVRADPRSGRALWEDRSFCDTPGQTPESAKRIGGTVYAACGGGELFALDARTGRILARQRAVALDSYDQIQPIGTSALAVGGSASGAYMFRQSALLDRRTLKALVIFQPDRRILGEFDGTAIVAEGCCMGQHDDNWPLDVDAVSLQTGQTIWSTALHPYDPPLPPNDAMPGAAPAALWGKTLYVGTTHDLFAYDLARRAQGPPKHLYAGLWTRPAFLQQRYVTVTGANGRSKAYDAVYDMMLGREVWRGAPGAVPPVGQAGRSNALPNVPADCRLGAVSAHAAAYACGSYRRSDAPTQIFDTEMELFQV